MNNIVKLHKKLSKTKKSLLNVENGYKDYLLVGLITSIIGLILSVSIKMAPVSLIRTVMHVFGLVLSFSGIFVSLTGVMYNTLGFEERRRVRLNKKLEKLKYQLEVELGIDLEKENSINNCKAKLEILEKESKEKGADEIIAELNEQAINSLKEDVNKKGLLNKLTQSFKFHKPNKGCKLSNDSLKDMGMFDDNKSIDV